MRGMSAINKYFKGQSLVEVLVALGVILVVATSLSGVVITSMGNVRISRDKSLATQYAQDGLEIVRQIRDSDYAAFQSITSGTYCLAKDSIILEPDCSAANVDNFLRKITITQSACAVNIARVSARVSWRDSRCPPSNSFCFNSQLDTCLSAVNPVPPL
jgi:Tfp pilus assembly protein PilV